jgi:hypothetical protein
MPFIYQVQEGESLASIALEHGFFPDTLWQLPDNAALKSTRGDPNVLLEGDIVVIPDKRLKEAAKPDGKSHRFRRKGVPAMLRLRLLDDEDKARGNVPYRLDIDGKLREGRTTSDGFIEEALPPDAREGQLILGEGEDEEKMQLEFSQLNPSSEVSGAQHRLTNLGYGCGDDEPGTCGPGTRAALQAFQRDYQLAVTGECDAVTKKKLKELHLS